ncbi:MAG: hypothetical protein WDW38_010201 [Sanguina aurantia]
MLVLPALDGSSGVGGLPVTASAVTDGVPAPDGGSDAATAAASILRGASPDVLLQIVAQGNVFLDSNRRALGGEGAGTPDAGIGARHGRAGEEQQQLLLPPQPHQEPNTVSAAYPRAAVAATSGGHAAVHSARPALDGGGGWGARERAVDPEAVSLLSGLPSSDA